MTARQATRQLSARDKATIIDRRLRGEALAAIARDYRCSARRIRDLTRFSLEIGDGWSNLPALDAALAQRLARATTRFVSALEAAAQRGTPRDIAALRRASDHFMRATARLGLQLRAGGLARR